MTLQQPAGSTWLIDPLDTLFFREGRAFAAGESASVQTIFPPPPSTLQGMVRSKLLADHCGRWATFKSGCHDKAGRCDRYEDCQVRGVVGQRAKPKEGGVAGTLALRGPWLARIAHGATQRFLPMPADVVTSAQQLEESRHGERMATTLLLPASGGRCGNWPEGMRPLAPAEELDDVEPVRGWLAWEEWGSYLAGVAPTLVHGQNWLADSDVWAREPRPGLAIEPGRNRAKDQHLYFAEHARVQAEIRLAFEVSGDAGLLADSVRRFPAASLGGEMRAGTLTAADAPNWERVADDVRGRVTGSARLKVVLLQSAWFAGGWQPRLNGNMKLLAALVNRPPRPGGWDVAAGREKPVRPFVPAGSVFFFEGATAEDFDAVWNRCVSDSPAGELPGLDTQGFGHALAGTWRDGGEGESAGAEDEDDDEE